MNETILLLKTFCARDRWGITDLTRPFSRGEWTYATDGKIIVRVPRVAEVTEFDAAPHEEPIWPKETPQSFVPVLVSELPKPEFERCVVCCGRGKEHDCQDCECTCEECEGSGQIEVDGAVSVGPGKLTEGHAKAIMALPGAEVAPVAEGMMQFRFSGGEGVVMLLTKHCRLPVIGSLIAETVDA
jgi:hypothetical protein